MARLVQPCTAEPCPALRAEAARIDRLIIQADAAAAAYEPPDQRVPPAGHRNATPEDLARLNLTPEMVEHPYNAKTRQPSAFRAAVFIDESTGDPLIAFKGSSVDEDWTNNRQQFLGQDSFYYTQAQVIATRVAASPGGANAQFAGHSLGGGLASAASRASGKDAATFNAAALRDSTVPQPATGGTIDAVHVRGDPLTRGQDLIRFSTSNAQRYPLDPPANFNARMASDARWYELGKKADAMKQRQLALHSMTTVKESLQERKTQVAAEMRRNNC